MTRVTGGPAPADVTNAIADRANELLGNFKNIKRVPFEQAVKSDLVERFDFREHYVADLENVIDFDVIRSSGVRRASTRSAALPSTTGR